MKVKDRIKELRRVSVGELLANPKNYRKHPQRQRQALREVLARIGFADALLARETERGLELIDGHLRKEELDPKQKVPVLILDVNEREADEILLTLDPLAGMANIDAEKLEALTGLIEFDSTMLSSIWGSRPVMDLKDPEARPDLASELRAKWGTEPGQAWQIGKHRLVCGDCREKATVGALWAGKAAHLRLIWTDPPYGVDYASKNAYLNRSDRGNRIQIPIENDELTAGETGIMFKQALEVGRQFAQPGAGCYATVPSGPLLVYFIQAFTAAGFSYRAQLVWVKSQFVIGMADYHHKYEPILYGWLPGVAHYFVDDRKQDDVFEIDKPRVSRSPSDDKTGRTGRTDDCQQLEGRRGRL